MTPASRADSGSGGPASRGVAAGGPARRCGQPAATRRHVRSPALVVLDASISPLTDREIQVLRLLAEGHTNGEIARRLYLSLRTVETHRGQLRAKLGLQSRAELIGYAREHGLVH